MTQTRQPIRKSKALKEAANSRNGRTRKHRRIVAPVNGSDTYENGRRVTGMPTVFDRLTAKERDALKQLRDLELEKVSPSSAQSLLKRLHKLVGRNGH